MVICLQMSKYTGIKLSFCTVANTPPLVSKTQKNIQVLNFPTLFLFFSTENAR